MWRAPAWTLEWTGSALYVPSAMLVAVVTVGLLVEIRNKNMFRFTSVP